MRPETASLLLELNQQFYQTFAVQFSATRQRLQPGVLQILEELDARMSLLDLGCGNGMLARALAKRGHHGHYTGLDFSPAMLAQVKPPPPDQLDASWVAVDLSTQAWEQAIPGKPFDLVVAFAVLHHLPGERLRQETVQAIRHLLKTGGRFVHSNWQFLNSPRLRARIQPWEEIGLRPEDVDPGDYLLDWRQGGNGLRYVHYFTSQELENLAYASGFTVTQTFLSDGDAGSLGLYQTWQPFRY